MADPPSYLDELDQLLLDQGDDWMLLTQLDGYLTAILVSPDMVPPASWLKHIWAGEDGEGVPQFDRMDEFQHLIDLIMRHYNDVLASLNQPGSYEPLFDIAPPRTMIVDASEKPIEVVAVSERGRH
jgi:uncharacterized protein